MYLLYDSMVVLYCSNCSTNEERVHIPETHEIALARVLCIIIMFPEIEDGTQMQPNKYLWYMGKKFENA